MNLEYDMSKRVKEPAATGLPAGDWINIFRGAKVEVDRLEAAKSAQGRATIMGNFLARMVGRPVPIEVDGRAGRATLRKAPGQARKQLYFFEVVFDEDENKEGDRRSDDPQPTAGKTVATKKRPPKEAKKPTAESRDNPIDRTPASGLLPAGNQENW